MDFEISHSFSHNAAAVAAAILDEGYQRSLADVESLKERELLTQEERADGTVVRRTRCVLDINITGAARGFIGEGDPAWVEEATWFPDRSAWKWVIRPEIAQHLLEANGDILISGNGDKATRVVEGHVKVKVPIYGGRVEGWIVDGLEHAYKEEAERLQAWLDR